MLHTTAWGVSQQVIDCAVPAGYLLPPLHYTPRLPSIRIGFSLFFSSAPPTCPSCFCLPPQPYECPSWQRVTPVYLGRILRNKVVVVAGDSVSKGVASSLICLVDAAPQTGVETQQIRVQGTPFYAARVSHALFLDCAPCFCRWPGSSSA